MIHTHDWAVELRDYRRWTSALRFLLVAQALDLLTALWCIALVGVETEGNLLMQEVWYISGPIGFVAVKALGVLLGIRLAQLGPGRPLLIFGACVGLFGLALNSLSLWIILTH